MPRTVHLHCILILLSLIGIPSLTSAAWDGHSLFSGVTVFEGKEGVVVLDIKENTPMKNAGIKKGDIILRIEGKVIENMADYVTISRELKGKGYETHLHIKRNDRISVVSVDTYSLPIKKYWGEKVPLSIESTPEDKHPYDYWINQGKMELDSIKEDIPHPKKIEIYRKAINNIFTGLHYMPKQTEAVILAAETYSKIGGVLINAGLLNEAVGNFQTAIRLYKKAVAKTSMDKETLMAIREDLKRMEAQLTQNLEATVTPTP